VVRAGKTIGLALGTRTAKFDETAAFFRDVLGLSLQYEEPGFAMFQLPAADRDFVEVFAADRPEVTFYTTGPVVGLLVDDIVEARAELDAVGVELIGSIEWLESMDGYGWFYFRGPDGNVYAALQGSTALPGQTQV
jgi:catechol 2,3-dioxygenase-like lactoylglutathione lyase family enzyme